MHRYQLLNTPRGAAAQGHALLQVRGPTVAFVGSDGAVVMVGKVNQGQPIIAGQHHHGFADELLVALYAHGQGYIEKVFFKVRWKAFGLVQ